MSEMVERVARAIYEADDVWNFAFPWPTMGGDTQSADNYRRIARAAIKEMREPDVKMIAAFWRQKNCGTQEVGSVGDDRSDYAAFRAMIDAALEESK